MINNYFYFSWEYHFIKSQFSGQLPQQYQDVADATKVIPPNMNDMNIEEYSRYVSGDSLSNIFFNFMNLLVLVFF